MDEVVESLKRGVHVGGLRIYAGRVFPGRFPEEINLEVYVEDGGRLLNIKVFKGRGFYRPWAEIFGIVPRVRVGRRELHYFGSEVEDAVLRLFPIPPGGRLFVEYYEDEETWREMRHGVPPPATRLGYKLLKLGYTWFKDWYYPEGFMEGGIKLQAERPLGPEAERRHLREIREELERFLERGSIFPDALRRAEKILGEIGGRLG